MRLKKKLLVAALGVMMGIPASAQFTYGTTGLLNMQTADMQKDKTVMIGGGYLSKYATPYRWNYNTWNYYLNVTIFPWLEVAYTMNLFTAKDLGLEPYGYSGYTNQDRNFSVRLRVWKEGWWKPWTPQLVVGGNDFTTGGWKKYTDMAVSGDGNGYFNRYFVALTKHVDFSKVGTLGVHASYIYNRRTDYPLNGVAFGANFRFDVPGTGFWSMALNGLNVMAEAYPADCGGAKRVKSYGEVHPYTRGLSAGKYDFNVGACYSLWKDRINLYGHFYGCKDFSGGVQFKICLK